ncbi:MULTISPECIES: nucleoside triphosphate pyrophosphohydrolase [unclassified Sphingopyxis]|uniref:nucleoside triphosphate pyrophosphohydrolase n=1 Tax=unclassified Sphingopyxis TaxID=2614943 RepID=UPI000736BE7F|nr:MULTISPECIES: nucleoside triphosphate pyrophosphohydrolase [unclassified Sphingopyxis]KTE30486.1 nucleoside triphosphate hydrolase [Sphingopyxis sp. HIX]KTE79267.1 nucleoside triphosphate hydrolase [Sphingopyxis sp. HXXIV]
MPADEPASPASPIDRLLGIMRQLRNPDGGCEWDLAQDFSTIAPYTIEEAYEVADAIAGGDPAAICDELGDLLLQVVFHAQIAADDGLFTFDDVANAISAKMERRHPHIFGDVTTSDVRKQWEAIKADERAADGPKGALDGVALSLPALMRAQKLQGRAVRVGFDWPDTQGPRDKIAEELAEVAAATDDAHRHEEVGDLLFAVVNYARKLGVDAESALRDANLKFARRFAAMETRAGGSLQGLSLDAQEAHWQAVKASE